VAWAKNISKVSDAHSRADALLPLHAHEQGRGTVLKKKKKKKNNNSKLGADTTRIMKRQVLINAAP
jgi:hypothetical protein